MLDCMSAFTDDGAHRLPRKARQLAKASASDQDGRSGRRRVRRTIEARPSRSGPKVPAALGGKIGPRAAGENRHRSAANRIARRGRHLVSGAVAVITAGRGIGRRHGVGHLIAHGAGASAVCCQAHNQGEHGHESEQPLPRAHHEAKIVALRIRRNALGAESRQCVRRSVNAAAPSRAVSSLPDSAARAPARCS